MKGGGFKANFFDVATGCDYWISGPRKDGLDALYPTNIAPVVDDDCREEYWSQIRTQLPRGVDAKGIPRQLSPPRDRLSRHSPKLATTSIRPTRSRLNSSN